MRLPIVGAVVLKGLRRPLLSLFGQEGGVWCDADVTIGAGIFWLMLLIPNNFVVNLLKVVVARMAAALMTHISPVFLMLGAPYPKIN